MSLWRFGRRVQYFSGFQQDSLHRSQIPCIARLEGAQLAISLLGLVTNNHQGASLQEKSSKRRKYYLLAFNSSLHPN